MKVKVRAKKMSPLSVEFISLVDRASNRIPFKIVKQEKPMAGNKFASLDLGALFTQKSDQGVNQAEVLGVVTMKDEYLDQVKQQITEAGYKTEESNEFEDGSIVFKQEYDGDLSGEGLSVIKVGYHAAVVVKGFDVNDPELSVDGQSFGDLVEEQGAYPGVSGVLGILNASIQSTIKKAEDPASAAASVAVLFDAAKAYTTSLLSSVPLSVHGLETIAVQKATPPDMEKKDLEKAGEKTPESAEKDFATCGECPTPEECKAAGKCKAQATEKSEADDGHESDPNKDASGLAGKLESVMLGIKKSEETFANVLAAALAPVTQKLDEAFNKLDEVTGRVEKMDSALSEANKVIEGITPAGSESGDPAVKKAETRVVRDIDTAFMPRKSQRRR